MLSCHFPTTVIRTGWGEDINGCSQRRMKAPAGDVVHTKRSSVMDYLLITEGKGELNKRGGSRQALPESSDQASEMNKETW